MSSSQDPTPETVGEDQPESPPPPASEEESGNNEGAEETPNSDSGVEPETTATPEADANSSSTQPDIPSVMHRVAQFERRSTIPTTNTAAPPESGTPIPTPDPSDEGSNHTTTEDDSPESSTTGDVSLNALEEPHMIESTHGALENNVEDEMPPSDPAQPTTATPTSPEGMGPTSIARVDSNDTAETFPSLQEGPTDEYMSAVARAAPSIPASDGSTSTPGGPDAFDIAMAKSQDYQPPENEETEGGRMWDASQPTPVPAVAQREAWLEEAIQPPAMAMDDVTESTGTSANNAFDVAMSRSIDYQAPSTGAHETQGGPLWEASKPTPPPAVLSSKPADDTGSPALPTSDVSASTATTKPNAFDIVLRKADEVAPETSQDIEDDNGGRLWEASKPVPIPAVLTSPKPSSHMISSDASASTITTNTNAFDIALSKSANYQSHKIPKEEDEDGGPMWEASKPAPPTPIPAVLTSPSKVEGASPQATQSPDDVTESTATGTNAFDKIMSSPADIQQHDGDHEGGRMWEASKPAPIPAVLSSPPSTIQEPDTCDATASTVTDAFDFAMARSADEKPTDTEHVDGGRMWDASKPGVVPAVLANTVPEEEEEAPETKSLESSDSTEPTMGRSTFEKFHTATPTASVDGRTIGSVDVTEPTVGGSTFEKLRAPTPDAFDVAMGKSEDFQSTENFEDEDGGEMWTAAAPQLIKEQTQSRAAPYSDSTSGSQRMISPKTDDDLNKLKTSKNIRQRRRMTQLLVVGAFVTIFGWMGNFFVADSCHFVAAPIEVGQYNSKFEMHYGLWKYSPPESALMGYPFCSSYSGNHEDEAPIVASIFHLLSLAAGSFSLGVLWYYIVSGASSPSVWKAAMWVSVLAAVFQLLTLLFFASNVCQEKSCEWGFGSSFVFVIAFSWIVLALELRYQAPHLGLDDSKKPGKGDDTKRGIELTSTTHTSSSARDSIISGDYKPPLYL